MTDPTPDATSVFERACAASMGAECGWPPERALELWRKLVPSDRQRKIRGFAAGLRELRSLEEGEPYELGRIMELHEWQAILNAVLEDAPDDR